MEEQGEAKDEKPDPKKSPMEIEAIEELSADAGDGESHAAGEVGLRTSAIQGGAYLAAREIVGIAIRAGGIVIVTRLIGPSAYGTYAAAAAFATVIAIAAQMGMEVYLIRQADEPSDDLYNQVFSFLLVLSTSMALLAAGLSVFAAHLIEGIVPSQRIFLLLMASVPINVLWAPAQAKIERAFGFRRIAWLELGGDAVFYGLAVVLAVVGTGGWSLAIAFFGWQMWLLVGSIYLAELRPRWRWSRKIARDLTRHGVPYSTSGILGSMKGLINPIVVGRYYGSTGVGYVALALRMIDTLGFAQRATWRLGMVALTKVRDQGERLTRGIEQGMILQLLATSGPILGVCLLANWLIPTVLGQAWTPMIVVFAWLAVGRIMTAPLTIEFAVLYSASKNTEVAIGTAANLVVTLVATLLLVPTLGLAGYGVAGVIGILGWVQVHLQARRVASFRSWPSIRLMIGLLPIALFPAVAWPVRLVLLIPAAVIVLFPQVHRELAGYARLVWGGLRSPSTVGR